MKKYWKAVLAVFLSMAAIAFAENVDLVDSPKPQWLRAGAYVGPGSPNATATAANPLVVNGNMTINGDAGFTGSMSIGAGNAGYMPSSNPVPLFSQSAVTFSNGTALQGLVLPQTATITGYTGKLTTASAGTGSVTITCTDGTNTCTATAACGVSAIDAGMAFTTPYLLPAVNGSGTGCVYVGGALFTCSVSASNCGTTTPIGSFGPIAKWQ